MSGNFDNEEKIMAVEHNTELDEAGKKYLPEGHALDVDRQYTANKVTTDINEWKDKTSKMDLKGFDTRDAKEPTVKEIIKRTVGDIPYVQENPEKWLTKGYVSRRLLEQGKNEVHDFASFKEMVKRQWNSDDSLKSLVENMDKFKDEEYRALFETDEVQSWLNNNMESRGINIIMRKNNIEPHRAKKVWNKLSPMQRSKVLDSAKGKFRFSQAKLDKVAVAKPEPKPQNVVTQVSKAGTSYTRQKPVRWSVMQIRMLRNNQNTPLPRLLEQYNSTFPSARRTISSLRNKLYRIE